MTTQFVLALLFSEDLNKILLVHRAKKPFANCCNGPGGEVEPGETPAQAILREVYEETGLTNNDLLPDESGNKLKWVGTLAIPYNRKYPDATGDETSPPASIYYYAARLSPDAAPTTREPQNKVVTLPVKNVLNGNNDMPKLAGHGNLEYFIREAIIVLTDPSADMQ